MIYPEIFPLPSSSLKLPQISSPLRFSPPLLHLAVPDPPSTETPQIYFPFFPHSSRVGSCLLCEEPPTMPATDSSVPFVSFGRSFLSLRRDHLHSADDDDTPNSSSYELELEAFQKRVADLFNDVASASSEGEEILSIPWIRKLLDAFIICQEEFRLLVLLNHKGGGGGGGGVILSRSPLDRLVTEFFERAVKALDVCNAIRDGVDQIRQWEKQLEIVLVALGDNHRMLGEGQLRRAKKALAEFMISMLDEKEAGSMFSHRNRSFGRNGTSGKDHHSRSSSGPGHSRSSSWSVSRSWSAARQLQAIGNNLAAPRSNEVAATNGLAVPVYTMNSVLLFVMWALVAAIPCQDRGIQIHFSVPRSFVWAAPVMAMYERIVEESKKKDRKNSNGLLKEIHQIDKCVRNLTELTDVVIQFPMEEEKEAEVREKVKELAHVCDVVKDGLDPLERQVREVFRRIVRSRTEGLDNIGQAPCP